jgi:hypothetical protein
MTHITRPTPLERLAQAFPSLEQVNRCLRSLVYVHSREGIALLGLDPISTKIADLTAIIQLRERIGMEPDQDLRLAIEALQSQVVDLSVPTLKSRDLHYAENFWSEMRLRG